MHSRILLTAALAFALSACADPDPPPAPATAPAGDAMAGDPAAPPPLDQPADAVPAVGGAAPAEPGAMPAEGAIGFAGFGPARFGADAEQVRMAWGRELTAMPEPAEPGGCHYLMPEVAQGEGYRVAFMIEGDRFVRIDVRDPGIGAPGGGRIGMDAGQIEALYPGRVETRPHKYVEDASYLRIADDGGGDGVLVFETDAAGRVDEWRVGVAPQVDYVEGCS
ncbi:lectin [Luteimonas sp. RD2P54]|uniref:Lectin n=1 Tax=Luteimonas endophytica TaxID=3042023 RepID=A0ABT6J880_9GAMM|nr:lectin [Luteimonas endophytica]MDH5823031.1 lectin [Luteimonas endophytica]